MVSATISVRTMLSVPPLQAITMGPACWACRITRRRFARGFPRSPPRCVRLRVTKENAGSGRLSAYLSSWIAAQRWTRAGTPVVGLWLLRFG